MGARHQTGGLTRWRLKGREKYRLLLIFRKAQIFPVFDNTHNLNARSILQHEISPDCIGYGAKQLAGKLPIRYGDGRRVFVVMPSESPARQGACTGRIEVPGRYVVPVGRRSDIRWPPIPGLLLEDIHSASGGVD